MSPAPGTPTVGVVGGGMMGSGIAEACAFAGMTVRLVVSSNSSAGAARRRIDETLAQRRDKDGLTVEELDRLVDRISFTTDLTELAVADVVIEAVTEFEELKLSIFSALDKIVESPDAFLASTTSSIPIVRLARATTRPGRVIGLHFFSPVRAMKLVEVVPSLLTDDITRRRAEDFVTSRLGKESITAPDRAGFIVNSLLLPYLLAAVRMLDRGHASAEAIDRGMVLGCGHPVGPLRLLDLVGLDLVLFVARVMFEEHKDPAYAPPSLLLRLVEAGHVGRKSGRGFYEYTPVRGRRGPGGQR